LKIADFGFAGPIAGRDGSGYLRTILGTVPYMAPELNEKQPYKGEKVDVFAAAVILFIMVSGTPPFNQARKDEFYYKYFAFNRPEIFWKYHEKSKPSQDKFFEPEFKDLINRLFSYNPSGRLSVEEILSHPWMQGEIATP
jgi:serine/threonine protein kinase